MSDEQLCYLRFRHSVDFHDEGGKEKVGRRYGEKTTGLVLGLRESLIFLLLSIILPFILTFYYSAGFPEDPTSQDSFHL